MSITKLLPKLTKNIKYICMLGLFVAIMIGCKVQQRPTSTSPGDQSTVTGEEYK